MKQFPSPHAWFADSEEAGFAVRRSSLPCGEPVTSSSLPASLLIPTSRTNRQLGPSPTIMAAGSRTASPHPTRAALRDYCCKNPPKRSVTGNSDGEEVGFGGGDEEDEDEDGEKRRSGSCSRWISRSSSFSLATGGMTPLTWRMSSMTGDDSMFHYHNADFELSYPPGLGEGTVDAVLMRQDAKATAMEESIALRDPNSMYGLLTDRTRCDESSDEDESPPMRERSMAPGELLVDGARQHLRLRREQMK